jgi:molybdenum cofactor sulfurtransferase
MLTLLRCGRIRKSFHKAATYTLLDAAALASTAPLDLSDTAQAPDFVALSFYKIFGFPNIGALIVRKDSAHVLQSRKYFGGGTVDMIITIQDTWHAKKEGSLHDRLEDGTLPFHSIFALDHAMTVHERLYGPNPMKFISLHTAQLGKLLYDGLSGLKHSNGVSLCRIYKDDAAVYGDASLQGATIAFNVVRADGNMVGYEDVEEAADERNIFVRSGSLCNPGGMATYLQWSPPEMRAAYAAGHRCTNPTQIMMGKATGVVRVSLGAMSSASDVRALLRFLEDVYLEKEGQPRAIVAQATQMARTVQVPFIARPPSPVTPGSPTALPPISTSCLPPSSQHAPATAASGPENSSWTQPDSGLGIEPAERPRFIPEDYIRYRKPWEAELRNGKYSNMGMEIKVRELDDALSRKTDGTPSVKARKFGRSVVNLLRNKHADPHARYVAPRVLCPH